MNATARRSTRARGAVLLGLALLLAGCGSGLAAALEPHGATRRASGLPRDRDVNARLGASRRASTARASPANARSARTHDRAPRPRCAPPSKRTDAGPAPRRRTRPDRHRPPDQPADRDELRPACWPDVGGAALAPLQGTLRGAGGQADRHLPRERVVRPRLHRRDQRHRRGGSSCCARASRGRAHRRHARTARQGRCPRQGTTSLRRRRLPVHLVPGARVPRRCTAARLPAAHGRVHRSALCGPSAEDTPVNTLSRIARLIYEGERGPRTLPQVRRVQSDPALLHAVAARDPAAVKASLGNAAAPPPRASPCERRRQAPLRPRRPVRARPGPRRTAPARAHDRQLRAVDPGRRGLHAPGAAPGRAERADVHGAPTGTQLVKNSLGRWAGGPILGARERLLRVQRPGASASSRSTPRPSRLGR